jgi:hypothetical protein
VDFLEVFGLRRKVEGTVLRGLGFNDPCTAEPEEYQQRFMSRVRDVLGFND